MKTSKYAWMAAAVLALAACNNDEEFTDNGPAAAQITAGVSGPATRAIDNQWEADEIGVMVTDAPTSNMETLYKNVKYTTTSNTTSANFTAAEGEGIFFQDADEKVTFAAYAPYQKTDGYAILPGTAADGVVSGSTADQSTREKQKAFDYIFASGATASRANTTVSFTGGNAFSHKMSRLIIVLKTSTTDGFSAEEVKDGTYTLEGLNHSGTFNVTTGEAKAKTTETSTQVESWSLTDYSLETDDDTQKTKTFTSILYPQTYTALTLKAVIAGQTYTAAFDGIEDNTLVSGYSYTYTVTVKKTGLKVESCTIASWTEGGSYNGDATMK